MITKDFFYFSLFLLKRGRGNQRVVASHAPPARDLACNPGKCPDWKSNQQPFGLQARAQSTEPHQPGLVSQIK